MKRILSILLVGCLVFGIVGPVFAAEKPAQFTGGLIRIVEPHVVIKDNGKFDLVNVNELKKKISNEEYQLVRKSIPEMNRQLANDNENGEIEIAGFKGWLVSMALQIIKQAIKYGGDVLSYILKWFDADIAKYFKSNTTKITNAIDDVLAKLNSAQDYAQSTIRSMLYSSLITAGVPGKYALPIADAIARTVTELLL